MAQLYFITMMTIHLALITVWILEKVELELNELKRVKTLEQLLVIEYQAQPSEYWDKAAKAFMLEGGWEDGEPSGEPAMWTDQEYQKLQKSYRRAMQKQRGQSAMLQTMQQRVNIAEQQSARIQKENRSLLEGIGSLGVQVNQPMVSTTNWTDQRMMVPDRQQITFMGRTPAEITDIIRERDYYRDQVVNAKPESCLAETFPGKAFLNYDGFTWLVYCLERKEFVGNLGFLNEGKTIGLTRTSDPKGRLKTSNPTCKFWEKAFKEINKNPSSFEDEYVGSFSSLEQLYEALEEL